MIILPTIIAGLLLCSSCGYSQELRLVGKWTAVNVKPDEQVNVICEVTTEDAKLEPVWLLSEYQMGNKRIEVMGNRTYSALKVLPKLISDDSGEYVCGLNDTANNQILKISKFDLKLYDAKHSSAIKITVKDQLDGRHERDDARWTVVVESDEDFLIEPDFFVKSRHEISCKDNLIKHVCEIIIRNVSESDSNHYFFVAYNKYDKVTFSLVLLALQEVNYTIVSMMPQVYTPGFVTSPICMPDGPVTDEAGAIIRKHGVHWEYFECDSANCINRKQVPIENISNGTADEDQGALTYTLKGFSPKSSGMLKCEGVDSKGKVIASTKYVCVSEGPLTLTKNTTFLDDGKITLICDLSLCNYEVGIRWFFSSKKLDSNLGEGNLREIMDGVMNSQHGNVYRSQIYVDSLADGSYICKAKPLGNYPGFQIFSG